MRFFHKLELFKIFLTNGPHCDTRYVVSNARKVALTPEMWCRPDWLWKNLFPSHPHGKLSSQDTPRIQPHLSRSQPISCFLCSWWLFSFQLPFSSSTLPVSLHAQLEGPRIPHPSSLTEVPMSEDCKDIYYITSLKIT